MRRRLGALGGFAAVAVGGVLLFVLVAALKQTPVAWTVGVHPAAAVATIDTGQFACQRPLTVPRDGDFDRVRLRLGTYRRPGPPLLVEIVDQRNRPLATGRLAGGYPDISGTRGNHTVTLDKTVRAGTRDIGICVQNQGSGKLAFYGNGGPAAPTSDLQIDGKGTGVDADIVLERDPQSYLSKVGSMLSRAVLFRSPRLSATLYFMVLVLLLGGAFAGLGAAVRSAARDSRP